MAKNFFTEEEKKNIVSAIEDAEKNTSGEVRLHIENKCTKDVLDRAAEVFALLKMHKTALRNGVLFYLAVEDHKFAILGDAGINKVVPPDFWDKIKEHCLSKFKEKQFSIGICEGIRMAGEQLKSHFPYQSDDINELSDEISFGNN
ncbi:MAG: TPM domain-containing protein [Bacteroidota bacterium]|nr:TPM domain-containing protein [Bacteroidota bacterium]